MLFQGSLASLLLRQHQASRIAIETSDNAAALQLLAGNGLDPRIEAGCINLAAAEKPAIADINRKLVQHGLDVYRIATVEDDLETIFMNLTNQ